MKLSEFLTLDNWCAGHMAKNGNDEPCMPHDPEAVRWCVLGATLKLNLSPDECGEVYSDLYDPDFWERRDLNPLLRKFGQALGFSDDRRVWPEDLYYDFDSMHLRRQIGKLRTALVEVGL